MFNDKKGGIAEFLELCVFTGSIFIFFLFLIGIAFGAKTAQIEEDSLLHMEKIVGHDLLLSTAEGSAHAWTQSAPKADELAPLFDPLYYREIDSHNWRSWRFTVVHPTKGEQNIDGRVPASAMTLGQTSVAGTVPLSELLLPAEGDEVIVIRLSKRGIGTALQPTTVS